MTAASANNRQLGSTAIELAFVLPLMLLILWAIVTFSSLLHARVVVARAAEDAARSISFLTGANRVEEIDPALLSPCSAANQISVTCEVIASLERSHLILTDSTASRFDTIKDITTVVATPNECDANGNALGIKVQIPFDSLRILPPISISALNFNDWMPSNVTACAVVAF
jgi:Flp pilus assembly protein TadG